MVIADGAVTFSQLEIGSATVATLARTMVEIVAGRRRYENTSP
jgi:hypothetical protein